MQRLKTLSLILILCLSILLTIAYAGISVVYRTDLPTKYFAPSSYAITCLTKADNYGINEHATSTANNLNITSYDQFPITLQYANDEYDYFAWHYEDLGNVPSNTVVYVYFNISQIAIAEGGKAVIFANLYTQYDGTNYYNDVQYILCNETHVWLTDYVNEGEDTISTCFTDAEGYAIVNITAFDPSVQLIICMKMKFLDENYKAYHYDTYIIQNNQIILSYNYNRDISCYSSSYLPTAVVIAKYQVTLADCFVSYDAPDVLLSEGTTTETTTESKWLNFSVNPSSYTIKYYNYSTKEVLKVGTGSLSEIYPYNSTILVKIFDDEGNKKFESKYTMTRDYDIYIDFEFERAKYNLTIKVYDELLREMTADYIYIDSKSWRSVKEVSVIVSEGSHRIRVYREGYKEFDNVVEVNQNATYCITLVPKTSNYTSDIGVSTPVNATIEEELYTNTTLYNPPSELEKDYYGFIFRNERSNDVTIVVYGTKGTLTGGWVKVPLAEVTIPANGNETLTLYVDDVNAYMNYKWGEYGQCFIIEDKSTGKTIVEAQMDAFKNTYRIIVIRDNVGMVIGGKGAVGGTLAFGTTLGILYMLLPIMIVLSLVSALTKMIKRSTR
ncbi:MAG: hypothetical protein DRP01_11135 [Archaeoglobales archaeon]|nr:MAG: hypothetical protein DRP01_11135 [Archaeoglobales archaeon]